MIWQVFAREALSRFHEPLRLSAGGPRDGPHGSFLKNYRSVGHDAVGEDATVGIQWRRFARGFADQTVNHVRFFVAENSWMRMSSIAAVPMTSRQP